MYPAPPPLKFVALDTVKVLADTQLGAEVPLDCKS